MEVIKSKGEIDADSLVKMTGYGMTTVNTQISILRRLGLITSHIRKIIKSICPPHVWIEEVISRPYGDT